MKIIEIINYHIGELLGRLYVSQYFSYEAKQRTQNLTNHLIEIYRGRLLRNEWMSEKTKEEALIKLETMTKKIGYPSQWKSYHDIRVNRRSYFESMLNIFEFKYRKKIKDLNRLVNRNEWFIPPQTVNAFYVKFLFLNIYIK
jgi:predicted metalloendopeptidase